MVQRVWESGREDDALGAPACAAARRAPADFEVEVVATRGDEVTVRIVSGTATDPAAILHLEGLGAFEIVRLEPLTGPAVLVLRPFSGGGA